MQVSNNNNNNRFVYKEEDHQILIDKKFTKGGDDNDIINEYRGKLLSTDRTTLYKTDLIKYLKSVIDNKNASPKTKAEIIAMLKDVQQSGELTDDDVKNAIAELTGEKATVSDGKITDKQIKDFRKTHNLPDGLSKEVVLKLIGLEKTEAGKTSVDYVRNFYIRNKNNLDIKNLNNVLMKTDLSKNDIRLEEKFNEKVIPVVEEDFKEEAVDLEKKLKDPSLSKEEKVKILTKFRDKWASYAGFIDKFIKELDEKFQKGELSQETYQTIKRSLESFSKTVSDFTNKIEGQAKELGVDLSSLKNLAAKIDETVKFIAQSIEAGPQNVDKNYLNTNGYFVQNEVRGPSNPAGTYKPADTSYQAAVKQQTVQDLLKEKRSEINEIETKFFTKLKENNAQWAKEIEKLETKIKDELRNIEKLLYSCCSVLSKEKVLDLTEKMLSAYKNAFKKLETYKNSRSLEKINELPAKMEELLDQELGQLLAEDKKAMTAQLDEQISLLSADQVPPKTIAGLKARRNSFVKTGNYKDFLAVMERGGRELSTADNISRYQKNEGDLRFEFAIALVKRKLVSDPQKGEEMLKALYDGIISNYNEKIAGQKTDRSAEQVLTQLKQLDKFVKEFGALGLSDKELQQKGTSLQIIKAQLLDKLAAIALGKAEKVTELFDSKNLSLDNKEKLSDKILEKIKQQLKNGNLESLKELINNPSSKAREILDILLQSGSLGKDVMAKLGEEELISLLDLRPDKAEEILNLIPKGKLETMLDKVAKGSSKHAQIEKALGKKAEVSA